MDKAGRALLDKGIKEYLINQVKGEFGDDFNLIVHRIEYLITQHNLKDLRWTIKQEIEDAKRERKSLSH
jgi:hypothetical protein